MTTTSELTFLESRQISEYRVVEFIGVMDSDAVDEIKKYFTHLLNSGSQKYILDLSGAFQISQRVVDIIIELGRKLSVSHGRLFILSAGSLFQNDSHEVLERFQRNFICFENDEDAEYFFERQSA